MKHAQGFDLKDRFSMRASVDFPGLAPMNRDTSSRRTLAARAVGHGRIPVCSGM